ncbi:hypothetical protein [Chryseobacterium polytrichastri]|uniref:Uncharacterized protein n=1 Tax=Chryseobacterium polytrichastri TaxID=1302687 RepID=A0A1M7G983_9FLAO|nr:hypothetical protein [Chryseobacterium polytrichastri]SHM12487.1 hypothetical protein SAMN05444267_103515 [Chryseobacterium polytrichastri]
MNMHKDSLEHQIKKQIEEREITPSRDLWSEIELQKEQKPSGSYMAWVWAAASIVLAFGLGFVLFSNHSGKEKTQHTEIAEIKNRPAQEKSLEDVAENVDSIYADKNTTPKNKVVSTKFTDEVQSSTILAEHKPLLQKKGGTQIIVPQMPKIKAEQIMAQVDSSKVPTKRKKYVDPSTLLFSVEHKDVIEKTKESNVASVDLNGK